MVESVDDASFMVMVWDILISCKMEMLMFLAAVVGYLLIFSGRARKDYQHLKLKAKLAAPKESKDHDDTEEHKDSAPKTFEALDAVLSRALAAGDHRAAFKHWHSLKQFSSLPSASLSQVVESMQCAKKDGAYIVKELTAFFEKHPGQCDMCHMNGIIESLGKRLDSQLMGEVVEMLPSLQLKKDERTYEIFLAMHATTRSLEEVQRLVAEMEAGGITFTAQARLAVMKSALQTGNFAEMHRQFCALKASVSSSWEVPRHVMAQVVDLACRNRCLEQLLPNLVDVPVPEEAINAMLSECISTADAESARLVETLARAQNVAISDTTYSLLIKALTGRPWRLKAVVDEVVNREPAEFSAELTHSVLSYCSKSQNAGIADTLLERMKPQQLNILSAFIRYYVESEQHHKACDVFEKYVQPLGVSDSQRRSMLDARIEKALMTAALQCGRTSVYQCLFDPSTVDVAKHVLMIRKCGSEGNLKGAMEVFKSLKDGGVELNSIIYNTVLDACVKCKDLAKAEDWMKQTQDAGFVDVVSYNVLIKAQLMSGNFVKARAVMDDMKKLGLQPNRVTFNEMINAAVMQGSRRSDIWELVKEMKTAEVLPNQVTCSILLKYLNAKSVETDILLVMDLIDAIDEQIDEVLLSSVVEACVRIGKPALLAERLEKFKGADKIAVVGAHTYGSLIKAYGHSRDVDGAWRCWKEMRSKQIKPTSITTGCMIEAVVNNGDAEGAFGLIHQMQDDDQCSGTVNSVIYCSVLKGFAREKKIERVCDVYEEMCKRNVEMSLIAFNTLVDACARAGRMDHLPKIMQDMKRLHVDPNIVTYSTIIKGHCQAGNLELGLSMMRDMKRTTKLKPDEIMYNSLLDGCAQATLLDEGLELLEEMQKEGVIPSNYTLSIMVKLLNRAHKVEQAFDLVKSMTQQHKFKPNLHVYTNLMSGCIGSRQLSRAVGVLKTMIKEAVAPDARTYQVLIRACFYQNSCEQAASLLRASLGLPLGLLGFSGCSALDLHDAKMATCYYIDHKMVNDTLMSLAEKGCGQSLAAPLLDDINKFQIKVNIDQGTRKQIALAHAGQCPARPQSTSNGKGKGKGNRSGW